MLATTASINCLLFPRPCSSNSAAAERSRRNWEPSAWCGSVRASVALGALMAVTLKEAIGHVHTNQLPRPVKTGIVNDTIEQGCGAPRHCNVEAAVTPSVQDPAADRPQLR